MVKIDIEMPESCFKCPIRHITEDFLGDFVYLCGFIRDPIKEGRAEQRHPDCPLKEVSDDGR